MPSFHALNPATGETLSPAYAESTLAEINAACAHAALAAPLFRATSGKNKAALLRRIAEEIEALGDALLQRYIAETALPAARAAGERGRTCAQLRLFAALVEEGSWVDARIDHADPERKPLPKPDTRYVLQALGPIAVFGPANFPLAYGVAGGDTASALAAGCPVVVKGHASHPGTSALVAQAIARALAALNFHPGTFALLQGRTNETGSALVRHPAIKAVGFTGSRRGGRALHDLCAARPDPIPFFGELSSLNPVIVLPTALRERAAALAPGLHAALTMGVGQFCTCPGLILVPASPEADALRAQLAALLAATPAAAMLNPGIRQAYADGVARLSQTPGLTAQLAPTADAGPGQSHAAPALHSADLATYLKTSSLHEENFGPSTLFVTYRDAAELETFVAQLEGQLTASLHGTEAELAAHAPLAAALTDRVGRLIFNGYPTGLEVCPSVVHGGPWPATTDSRHTAVGTAAIYRFARPVCFQNAPESVLPPELQDANPLKLTRLVDSVKN